MISMSPYIFFNYEPNEAIPPGYEYSPCRDKDMIVWKKALVPCGCIDAIGSTILIIKLMIPKNAGVVFTPSKCRTSRAVVLGFYPCKYLGDYAGQLNISYALSWYNRDFKYPIGHEVTSDFFDLDPHRTCSYGIHFFRTFEEAREYIL